METPSIIITREVQEEIIHSLRGISFPVHVKGYAYVKTALEIILSKPNSIEAITKELYPTIARTHHTTFSRVERGIRHGIELVYDRNPPEDLDEILGHPNLCNGKLTNSEFLSVMAENLRITLNRLTEQKENQSKVGKEIGDDARLKQLRQDLITLGVIQE